MDVDGGNGDRVGTTMSAGEVMSGDTNGDGKLIDGEGNGDNGDVGDIDRGDSCVTTLIVWRGDGCGDVEVTVVDEVMMGVIIRIFGDIGGVSVSVIGILSVTLSECCLCECLLFGMIIALMVVNSGNDSNNWKICGSEVWRVGVIVMVKCFFSEKWRITVVKDLCIMCECSVHCEHVLKYSF